MEGLIAADQAATLWINQHHNVVLDALVMPVAWFGEGGAGWIIIVLGLLIFGGRRERLVTLVFVGGLVITEYTLVPALRELWPRQRPHMYLEGIRALGIHWEKPSFPSAHTHLWTQATILYGVAYRRWLWPLIALSVITFYSRPYAGMHHILDVLGGIGLGGVMGLLELAVASKLGLLASPVPADADPLLPLEPASCSPSVEGAAPHQ